MRKCRDFQIEISSYYDGESGSDEKRDLFLHLAQCDDCQEFWENLHRLELRLTGSRSIAIPQRLTSRIASIPHSRTREEVSSFLNNVKWSIMEVWTRRLPIPLPLIAFVVLVSVGAWLFSLASKETSFVPTDEVIYYSTLPAVQVIGYYPPAALELKR